MPSMRHILPVLLVLFSNRAKAVTFEEQASRLQNVTAAIFDSYPKELVFERGYDLGVQLDLTLLPEIDGRVGNKNENIPQAPVHLMPKLVGTYVVETVDEHLFGIRGWGGVLPPGAESALGLESSLFHYGAGAELLSAFRVAPQFRATATLAAQFTAAEVKGKIASAEGTDTFKSTTLLTGVGAGVLYDHSNSLQFTLGLRAYKKATESEFNIEEDQTTVKLTDNLSYDALFGFTLTAGIGVRYNRVWALTLQQSYVPSRVFLPSIVFTWHFLQSETKENVKDSESEVIKKQGKTKKKQKKRLPRKKVSPPKKKSAPETKGSDS